MFDKHPASSCPHRKASGKIAETLGLVTTADNCVTASEQNVQHEPEKRGDIKLVKFVH